MPRAATVPTPRDLVKEDRLIPFVGAGLSQPLGLPSWNRLIDDIAVDLGYDPQVYRLSGDIEQLAGYYVATRGSVDPLVRKLKRRFDPTDRAIRASECHRLLVDMNLPAIYTTNYDRIIERAFKLHKRRCHTITSIKDIVGAPSNVTYVVKFHGSFHEPESLVLTEADYFERLDLVSALDLKLRADTLGRSLLFLGYSFSDMNMRYLLYKLHRLRSRLPLHQRRNPIAYLTVFGSNDVQRTLLKQWEVEVVELDPRDKTRSTERFLRSLR
jgi:hypothetical protein